MAETKKKILLCNCENTMQVDGKAIGKALNIDDLDVHTNLCRSGIEAFEKSVKDAQQSDGVLQVCVGCTQESALFSEIATEASLPEPQYFNIRETAGWSKDKKSSAKMAALTAQSLLSRKATKAKSIYSDGLCLVIGRGQTAFDAANLLNKSLSVSLILTKADDILLPSRLDFPVFCGSIKQASGSLGAFEIIVDGYGSLIPSSRSELSFTMARNGAKSKCSLIFDLSEGAPLFPRHEGRDGYFKPDASNDASVMRAILDASDLVGEFEKPLYVGYNSEICAHSRSQKVGCYKCIDNCPAGALSPNGDIIDVNLDICGGCGNCAAHCPTGAIFYQYPERTEHIQDIQTLARTYLAAGGNNATLLFHDLGHGMDLINASSRYGKGLPSTVIPLAMHSTSGIGHDALIAALGAGFSKIVILGNPKSIGEYGALEKEIELTLSILQAFGFDENRITLCFETDPDIFEETLWELPILKPLNEKEFIALGTKREIARTAIGVLAEVAKTDIELIPLEQGAPYGAILVDQDACTLCLACISACPADALRDNPDKPELRFVETACVQCGICRATCPEQAITLQPQLDLSPSAMQPITLKEEEPFECIKCGTPFAARSTIERISKQLAGSHRMFESDKNAQLLKMCDSCRLETLADGGGDPFAIAQRPVPRTTDDYLDAEQAGLTIDDYLKKDS